MALYVKALREEDKNEYVKKGKEEKGQVWAKPLNVELFLWRLKPCVRCRLEHLRRDFPCYIEIEKREIILQTSVYWYVKLCNSKAAG